MNAIRTASFGSRARVAPENFNMQYILNVIHQASCGTYVRGIMFADEGLAQLMKAQRFEAMFAISKNELRLQCP